MIMEVDMENMHTDTVEVVSDMGEVCVVNRYAICNNCNVLITGIDNLDDHICEVEDQSMCDDKAYVASIDGHSSKNYQCQQCDRSFNQASNLKRHERVHSGERPFVCEICDRRFAQGNNLKAHLRCHTNERPYACLHCDRTFIQSSNMYKHMRSHEDAESIAQYRRYSCALCDKSFVDSNVLRIHLRTHTGERPHSCPQCSRSFTQESNLRRHYRTHTGEKPFVCGICSRGFSQSNNLKAHMAVHGGGVVDVTSPVAGVKNQTVYDCDECDSQFLRRSNLEKHKAAAHSNCQRRIVVITPSGQRIDASDVKIISISPSKAEESVDYVAV